MCVVIEQGFGSDAMDTVLVDMSTLRIADISNVSTLSARCSSLHPDNTFHAASDKLWCCKQLLQTVHALQIENECKAKAASLGCSLSQDQTMIPFTIEIQDVSMPAGEDSNPDSLSQPPIEVTMVLLNRFRQLSCNDQKPVLQGQDHMVSNPFYCYQPRCIGTADQAGSSCVFRSSSRGPASSKA